MQLEIDKRLVETIAPGKTLVTIRDTKLQGFTLRVQPTGTKAWYLDYRNRAGRRQSYKLGNYPGLEPEGARRQAKVMAGKVAAGVDIQHEKKAARAEAERAKVATLGSFIEHRYEPWAKEHLRHGDVAVARLRADFEDWLPDPLDKLNTWRVESWRKERLRGGTKPVTVNRQIDTLKAALAKAVQWNIIAEHPLRSLRRLKVDDDDRVRYLSTAERSRLLEALVKREDAARAARDRGNDWSAARGKELLPRLDEEFVDHIRPLVMLLLNTGLRRGEAFSLRWSDLNLAGKQPMLTVRAAAAKSGKRRDVPLNAEAVAIMRAWQKQTGGEGEALVFEGRDGAKLTTLAKAWKGLCERAALVNFRLHDCRHDFASRLVQEGVDLNIVRELLGHADLSMTLRYGHLRPENLSAAVAKLA